VSKLPTPTNITKKLDEFIQNSLDFFKYTDVPSDLSENTSIFSKHLLNTKPVIPDLVIYNTTFNKNDCFVEGIHCTEYNSFPRVKFEVKVKPLPAENIPVSNYNEKNHYGDEEECEWEDVDAKGLEDVQVLFQKIPGMKGEKEKEAIILKLEEKEDSKVINVNSLFGVSFPLEPKNVKIPDLFSENDGILKKEKMVILDPFRDDINLSHEIINNKHKRTNSGEMPNHMHLTNTNNNIFKHNIPQSSNNVLQNTNNRASNKYNLPSQKETESLFSDLSLINRNIPSQMEDYPNINQKNAIFE
jgi:hypothetical protein